MKNKAIITICGVLLLLLSGCDDVTIRKLDISPKTDITVYSKTAKKQIQVRLSTESGSYRYDDAEQKIEWVSTNPSVAIVSGKERNSYDLDYVVKANIELLSEGTTEIYARTIDGEVESAHVKLMYGNRVIKEQTTPYDESPIKELKLSKKGVMEIKSGKESSTLSVELSTANGRYKNYDAIEKIEWVITNPEVAEVFSKEPGNYDPEYKVNAEITLLSEGITEIYAQTLDGSVVSDTIRLVYGNQFNKESTVDYDVATHIAQRLKYPTQMNKELYKARPSYIMRDRTIFVYRDNMRGSDVQISETTIDGLSVKAKGMINTFTENGTDAKCNFSLELEYNDDFTEYQIISETYGAPELILPVLD